MVDYFVSKINIPFRNYYENDERRKLGKTRTSNLKWRKRKVVDEVSNRTVVIGLITTETDTLVISLIDAFQPLRVQFIAVYRILQWLQRIGFSLSSLVHNPVLSKPKLDPS